MQTTALWQALQDEAHWSEAVEKLVTMWVGYAPTSVATQIWNETGTHGFETWSRAGCEISGIIAEHTGAAGVLEAPDLNMLGVTDHLRFFENFSYIRQEAEEAYKDGYYLEAISLRLLTLVLLLRIYVVHKTKQPVEPSIQFGQLLGKAKGQGFPAKTRDRARGF